MPIGPYTNHLTRLVARFFRAVRQVNQSLATNRQLRVLLADPPIDWAAVKTAPDQADQFDRDCGSQSVK